MRRSLRSVSRFGAPLFAMLACGGPGGLENLPRASTTASGGSQRPLVASTSGGFGGGESGSLGRGGRNLTQSLTGGSSPSAGEAASAGRATENFASGGTATAKSAGGGPTLGGRNFLGGAASSGSKAGGSAGEAPSNGGAGGAAGEFAGAGGIDSAGAAGTPTEPGRKSAFFSRYVEGTSSDKALEIVARETASLSGCSAQIYSNGSLRPSHTIVLTERVSFSEPLRICTQALASAASVAGLHLACHRIEALSFNGNDAVLLVCGDEVVDAIGRLGENPELRWGTEGLGTLDVSLHRDCGVLSGDPDPSDAFDLATNGWSVQSGGFLEGFGSHCANF